MRYEAYEERMKKILAALLSLRRHAAAIAVAVVCVLGATFGMLCVKGIFIEEVSSSRFVYGEHPKLSAKALFSGVRYSFRFQGTEDFSENFPTVPGEYVVRAAADGMFRENVCEAEIFMESGT